MASLDWRAVTRPPRAKFGRARIQTVERMQGNTSVFTIVSRAAGEEDAMITSVAIGGDGRDSEASSESMEMEVVGEKKEGSEISV